MRTTGRFGVVGAALWTVMALVGATGASAQADDSPWMPWLGCWVEVDAPADAAMTCFVPEQGGAALLAVTRSGVQDRRALRADGVERPVDGGGCTGVEAMEPSADGTRLYTRSRLACEGGTERATRGLMAMVAPDRWIRVRSMTVGNGSTSWVQRYRPAPESRVAAAALPELDAVGDLEMAVETGRLAAASRITVEDIIEAHGRTESEAVRAWLAERGQAVPLDAERLIRLAEAGVPEEVIDVAIAVTYPEHFAVAQEPEDRARPDARDRYGYGWGGYWPGYYDPFYFGYSPYNRYNRYNQYGLGLGGYYPYGSGTVIVVRPVDSEATPQGRAVKGRGYTRGGGGAAASSGTVRQPSSPSASRGGYSGSTRAAAPSSSSGSKGKAKPKGGG